MLSFPRAGQNFSLWRSNRLLKLNISKPSFLPQRAFSSGIPYSGEYLLPSIPLFTQVPSLEARVTLDSSFIITSSFSWDHLLPFFLLIWLFFFIASALIWVSIISYVKYCRILLSNWSFWFQFPLCFSLLSRLFTQNTNLTMSLHLFVHFLPFPIS